MVVMLDGVGTLQAQLLRALKAAIADGGLDCGARLPPTRELARELGVSRNTVLTAYEQLRAEGFMEARTGSGSFVAMPLLARLNPDRPPFLVLELPLDAEPPAARPETQVGDPLVRTA